MNDLGATPFIPFKSSSVGNGDSPLWNKLWHFFQLNKDEFLLHYHRRSNVETAFSMIKRVIGDTLRSKTRTAQVNEALLMVLRRKGSRGMDSCAFCAFSRPSAVPRR